jgi:predicted phage terminase large subunit-like protein
MTLLTTNEYEYVLRHDFLSFIERSFYELNPQTQLLMSRYIEAMATKLEACRQGKIKRLIINLPPRYLKSHCISIALPAWWLGYQPAGQIICASYGQELADKMARDCRTVMSSAWYKRLFRTRLSPEKLAVHDFMTTEQGSRMATSVGGVLTGRGADLIIIDDSLKPDDALSEVRRTAVNDWYDNSLLSRLNDKVKGCIIIVQQRLHQDDLVGHVCERDVWDILSFPAIAERHETHIIETPIGVSYFHRSIGDALHPERENVSMLADMRKKIGDYNFAAQYQQNPTPLGGSMVKTGWLRFYIPEERPAQFERIIQSWDTANKAGELNDFSVCTTWGEKDKHFYLLHVFRRRMEYPDLKRAVPDQARVHGAGVILIEDKASGTQLLQDLIADGVAGIRRYEPPPCDKIMRLNTQSSTFENGLVLLPKEAPWLSDYIHELTTFPGCKNDDQVDSTTQALAYLRIRSANPRLRCL